MATLKHFATDKEKEIQGQWIPIGQGIEIKIARMNNPKYAEFIATKGKTIRPMIRHKIQTPELTKEFETLLKKAAANCILLDWKNIEDETGKPLPYSVEEAIKQFEAYPEFYAMVIEQASDIQNFRLQDLEESLGN